jgi:hypothetical protein
VTELDLYLIGTPGNKYILFSPTDVLEQFEAVSDDRVQHFVSWLTRHPNPVVAWVGRVLNAAHGYYVRLEDRIDPQERVLKAMNSAERMRIHFAPGQDPAKIEQRFDYLLWRQRWKHIFWVAVDTIVCGVVAAFTPILAPIPGPNVLFYFPFLRWLSHYRAIRGASSALKARRDFRSMPELNGLEENLQASRFDDQAIRIMAERLKIRGLERFLERMV